MEIGAPQTLTAKGGADLPARICINNLLDRHVHASHTDEPTGDQRQNAEARHWPPFLPGRKLALVNPSVIQPKGTSQPVRIPTGKETRSDPDQIVEDGHTDRQDKRKSIHDHNQSSPNAPSNDRMTVQMPTLPEQSDEYQFRGSMGIQASRDQEIRYRDAIRRLLPLDRQRRERRRLHLRPHIYI